MHEKNGMLDNAHINTSAPQIKRRLMELSRQKMKASIGPQPAYIYVLLRFMELFEKISSI